MFGLFKRKRKKKKYVKPEINIVEKESYAYALTCINKIPGYLNVTIQRKGHDFGNKNYFITLGSYADEYVQKLVCDKQECERLYENYNIGTEIVVGKSPVEYSFNLVTR